MKKKLTHHLGLKLASFALAFVIWFLIIQIKNPTDSTTFNNIPVKLINTEILEKENKVYEVMDGTDIVRRVTVKAPRSIIDQLRADDIVAEADMNKLTDINTIVINFYALNADTDSIEGSNDIVKLNVEEKSSKWVKLSYSTVGEVAENYMISSIDPDQTMIEVTGPKSIIETIENARVEIDVTGAVTDLSANVEIKLYDTNDTLVEKTNVTKNVNYVHMSVAVLATKEVPIEAKVMGIPADGYMETGVVTNNPSMVKIAGRPSVLANISKITIPEEEINITGAVDNLIATVNIKEFIQEGVRFAETGFNGKITTTVFIEPKVEKNMEIPANNIRITNLPQGYTASLPQERESYNLITEGLGALINPLRANTTTGSIDIKKWMDDNEITELEDGTYTLEINFSLDENIKIVNPVTVPVTILKQTY